MQELDIYQRQGFGNASGFGERPALLIVDFVNGFTDPGAFGGGNIDVAIENTERVLGFFRDRALPIVFTRVVYADDGSDAGIFSLKAPNVTSLTESAHGSQVVETLTPLPGEYIVRKTQPSAFFGTSLASWLTVKKVDTLIVTGCTTSGCVRASVVDAMSHNFHTIVARDGVGDRALEPHEANLFDMAQKYADLLSCDEIIARLDALLAP
ncbi:MAG: isochorismatase family protein [Pseudomonadota bacterium]